MKKTRAAVYFAAWWVSAIRLWLRSPAEECKAAAGIRRNGFIKARTDAKGAKLRRSDALLQSCVRKGVFWELREFRRMGTVSDLLGRLAACIRSA